MDLIYTNANRVDQGVLSVYSLDLSYGESENNFEMTLGADGPALEFDAFSYIEGTEYGGIVDGIRTSADTESVIYIGRTWHGLINSKVIQPNAGQDYYSVSGDANNVLATLISRLGLGDLFTASYEESGITIQGYQFKRYCGGYDGIREMLEANGAKLKITWQNRRVQLCAVPVVDYTEAPVDGDVANLTVEQHKNKVNHLICLGRGELAEREVVHLYVDQFGRIGDVQYYTGLSEYTDTYDNSNSDDLTKDGKNRLKELLGVDKAEISIPETDSMTYDIGDVIGATELKSGVSVAATVTQKIVRINNGAISIEYKTGG